MIKEGKTIISREQENLQSTLLAVPCAVGNVGILNVARTLVGIEFGNVS